LVVAALCCLLLATVLLTFREWPGRGEASPGGEVTMTAPAAKAAGRAASGPVAPVATATGAATAGARERTAESRPVRRSAPRRGVGAPPAPPAGATPPAAPAPAANPAPATSQPAATGPQAPAPAADPPSQPAREPGRVEGVVETVRPVVEDPLPPAVRRPVQPVLDTANEVGRTVDETTGSLLRALP